MAPQVLIRGPGLAMVNPWFTEPQYGSCELASIGVVVKFLFADEVSEVLEKDHSLMYEALKEHMLATIPWPSA